MPGSDSGSVATPIALSDIIHTMSPSPVLSQGKCLCVIRGCGAYVVNTDPEQSTPKQEVVRATSPEPITDEVVDGFRKRLVEMGLSTDGMKKNEGVNVNSREEELLDMVSEPIHSQYTNLIRSFRCLH